MRLSELLDIAVLNQHLKSGVVNKQVHPTKNLVIFNYGTKAQFGNIWDAVSMQCRGLIVDGYGEVVARPFPKFFNLNTEWMPETMWDNLPASAPLITEKLDGSLGILYEVDGQPAIATRGSFESDQAIWASNFYRDNHLKARWPAGHTVLFEIIYKENRIVVDYDYEGLVVVGIIDNETGEELHAKPYAEKNGMRYAAEISKGVRECTSENIENEEGYVLTWPKEDMNPLKVKVKFADYVKLHKILTGLSNVKIWEMMRDGMDTDDLNGMIEEAPKEFKQWFWGVWNDLSDEYAWVLTKAVMIYQDNPNLPATTDNEKQAQRKASALYFTKDGHKKYAPICFALLDGKDPAPIVWKLVKPKYKKEATFSKEVS